MCAPLCDPGCEQRAETLRELRDGGPRLCGRAEYAIAPDEAPHPGILRRCQKRSCLGARRTHPHEDAAAVRVVRRDHRGTALPRRRITAPPHFDLPPVRTDSELIDAGENGGGGRASSRLLTTRSDAEKQLTPLGAARRCQAQQSAFLLRAPLGRIVGRITYAARRDDVRRPLDESRGEACRRLEVSGAQAGPIYRAGDPQPATLRIPERGSAVRASGIEQRTAPFASGSRLF